jgi:hypothetical protein
MSGAYDRIAEAIYGKLMGGTKISSRGPEYADIAEILDKVFHCHVTSTIKEELVKELGPEEERKTDVK